LRRGLGGRQVFGEGLRLGPVGGAGSGLPVPRRRTFAAVFLTFAHSTASALRHPVCAGRRGRLPGHGQPLASRSFGQRRTPVAEDSGEDRFLVRCCGWGRLAARARGCPCPIAGRSLRSSWPSLTPRRLRFDILSALAAEAGSRGTDSPSRVVRPGRDARGGHGRLEGGRPAFEPHLGCGSECESPPGPWMARRAW